MHTHTFQMTFFDFDEGWEGNAKECLTLSGFTQYTLGSNPDESELVVTEMADGRTRFCSSTFGTGKDNPSGSNILNQQQKDRSVAITFHRTACFELQYSIGCCSTGRNFLFAGDSAVLPFCESPPPPPRPPPPPAAPPGAPPQPPRDCSDDGVCGYPFRGCTPTTGFAQLDFSQATVAYSNIGGLGPDTSAARALRLDNVGTNLDGSRLDLLVTNRSRYRVNNAPLNGIEGAFGRINVYIGTSVDLTMTFVAGGTDEPVTLSDIVMSFYDFDNGGTNREVLTMSAFDSYNVMSNTEILVGPGSTFGRIFTATARGDGDDNPSDPMQLSELQRRRSVAFTYRQTSSINMTFDSQGTGNGGRNFLFAGMYAVSPPHT